MIITEEPVWYPIYADTNNNEFEKSTSLTDLDELEEEYGRKKRKGSNLKNLEISEISLCQSGKVGVKYLIQKGDEKKVINEKTLINDLGKRGPEKEVKKYDEIEWSTVQNQLYGYTEDDLSMLGDSDIEIEKGSPDDKWPSLSRQFEINRRRLEKRYEEYELESRLV